MSDLSLGKICDHRIYDEVLSINGLSPNYFAVLNYTTNGSSSSMLVREFSATEGLTNFNYRVNGMTNWNLLSDKRTIRFNTLGIGGGAASFLDGSTLIFPQAIMMASYIAHRDSCPKHTSGSSIENDISFDSGGRLRLATGLDKVRQQVTKIILTARGASRLHPDYGSEAPKLIGQKFDVVTQLRLQQTIQEAFEFLIQEQQSLPDLPLNETLTRVSNIQVSQDSKDPRAINILVKVQVASFDEVEVTLPVVVA